MDKYHSMGQSVGNAPVSQNSSCTVIHYHWFWALRGCASHLFFLLTGLMAKRALASTTGFDSIFQYFYLFDNNTCSPVKLNLWSSEFRTIKKRKGNGRDFLLSRGRKMSGKRYLAGSESICPVKKTWLQFLPTRFETGDFIHLHWDAVSSPNSFQSWCVKKSHSIEMVPLKLFW